MAVRAINRQVTITGAAGQTVNVPGCSVTLILRLATSWQVAASDGLTGDESLSSRGGDGRAVSLIKGFRGEVALDRRHWLNRQPGDDRPATNRAPAARSVEDHRVRKSKLRRAKSAAMRSMMQAATPLYYGSNPGCGTGPEAAALGAMA